MAKKDYLVFGFLGFLTYLFFLLSPIILPDFVSFFDDLSTQWFYSLNSDQSLSQDIVIVEIDDYSIEKVNQKWPLARSLYVKALDILDQEKAKVVSFDIIFQGEDESPAQDLELLEAIKRFSGKVVLGSALRPKEILSPGEKFQEQAAIGFINAPADFDRKIRRLRGYAKVKDYAGFSLAVETVALFGDTFPKLKGQSLVLGDNRTPLNSDGSFNLNYLLKPKDFQTISFYDLLSRKFPQSLFKDKIVLFGPTAEIIHDVVFTPLGKMSGVFVQANGMATLINQKYLRFLPQAVSLFILTGILFLSGFIISYLRPLKGLVLSVGMLSFLLWIDLTLKSHGFKLADGPIAVSAFGFFLIGNIYNYFKFLIIISQIKNKMMTDPLTGLLSLRYFYERASLELKSLSRKRRQLLVIFLKDFEPEVKKISFEELRRVWRELKNYLFGQSFLWTRHNNELILGLKTGKISLEALQKNLKTLLNERKVVLPIKIGSMPIDSSVNLREAAAYLAENIEANPDNIAIFKKIESGPDQKKYSSLDFISSLGADAEEKNRELLSSLEKLIKEQKKTEQAYLELISSLVKALEAKDPYTEGHSERVAIYAALLAKALNLSWEEQEKIRKAGLLHDLGKIGIPDEILHKKGKLSDEEFSRIKEHEVVGIKILEPIKDFKGILPYVLHHHESFDGTGYPHGLAGEFIPLGARIMAVVDIFDALSTGRDYKDAFSFERSEKILKEMKGNKLDPKLVDAFLEVIREHRTDIFKK